MTLCTVCPVESVFCQLWAVNFECSVDDDYKHITRTVRNTFAVGYFIRYNYKVHALWSLGIQGTTFTVIYSQFIHILVNDIGSCQTCTPFLNYLNTFKDEVTVRNKLFGYSKTKITFEKKPNEWDNCDIGPGTLSTYSIIFWWHQYCYCLPNPTHDVHFKGLLNCSLCTNYSVLTSHVLGNGKLILFMSYFYLHYS